jgi:NAD(P)-dependent dehydrogenase (short-subunit alcohol dehydrogenase family)
MSEWTVALATGANKGIGFQIAAGLGALGYRVGVAARDVGRRGTAVEKLRADGVDAVGVPLDVTSDDCVRAAAELLEEQVGRLDVLVDNAGISGASPQDPTTLDLDVLRTVLDTNVFGVIRVTNALLRRSAAARIVNVSSNMSSLTLQTGPVMAAYAPSKTMLNAVTVQYARQLAGTGILVNAACPGYVRHRLHRPPGVAQPRAGRRHARAPGHAAGGRAQRRVLRRRRRHPVVSAGSAR